MGIAAANLIEALPCPVIVVDAGQAIIYANGAAEYFFAASQSVLKRLRLMDVVPFSSPLMGLLAQVRQENARINEYAVHVGTRAPAASGSSMSRRCRCPTNRALFSWCCSSAPLPSGWTGSSPTSTVGPLGVRPRLDAGA